MTEVFRNLVVNEERMLENIRSAGGFIMAESVLLTLATKGMGRQEAHELVRQTAIRAEAEGKDLKVALSENAEVMALMTMEELDAAMDPTRYLGAAPELTDRVVEQARKALSS
jgi:adenylosuccinate lyase